MARKKTDAPPSIGHNTLGGDQLRSIVERVERLEEGQAGLAEDKREVYAEAKANGFDTKTIRAVVKLRKMDAAVRAEQEALLDLYLHALGMLADLPLGQAAMERDFPDRQEDIETKIAEQKKRDAETFEKVAGAAPVDPQA